MNKPKSKPIPRDQRKNTKERVFSTNFQVNIDDSGIKCWVPWDDYLLLKTKYEKLVKRRTREMERRITSGSLRLLYEFIEADNTDLNLKVIKAELGELILRSENKYAR